MPDSIPNPENFNVQVRFLEYKDIEFLPILLLQTSIDVETERQSPGMFQYLLHEVLMSLQNRNNDKYLVAEVNGELAGIIGLRPASQKVKDYAETLNPCEMIVPMVLDNYKDIHMLFITKIIELAKKNNYTEILLNLSDFCTKTAYKIMDIETGNDEYFSKIDGSLLFWRWIL